jgi:hypothetical protein
MFSWHAGNLATKSSGLSATLFVRCADSDVHEEMQSTELVGFFFASFLQ